MDTLETAPSFLREPRPDEAGPGETALGAERAEAPYSSARKLATVVLLFTYYVIGYALLNRFNVDRSYYLDLALDWERGLPLVRALVWGYYLPIPVISLMVLLLDGREILDRSVRAFLVTTSAAFLCFVVLPVRMVDRPAIAPDGTLTTAALELVYALDEPTNLFPSLHLCSTLLAALVTFGLHRLLGWVSLGATAVMALSVILIKQHYVADVLAGTLFAVIAYRRIVTGGSGGGRAGRGGARRA